MITIKDWKLVVKHGGLHKEWIYGSKVQYAISCDYLEKMNYSIQDFQWACKHIEHRANIIYLITMFSWIFDITEHFINKPVEFSKGIHSIINENVLSNYIYSQIDEFNKAKKYMKALRSFLLAHPLDTSDERHKKFDLDGKYFSVDVNYMKDSTLYKLIPNEYFKHLDYSGMSNKRIDTDIFIMAYPTDLSKFEHCSYIGFSLDDVIHGICLCMDALRELDIYLSKVKKKDYLRKMVIK